MKLSELIQPILHKRLFPGDAETELIEISDITSDSRKVIKNSLFVCLPGHTVDGHDFAESAIANGAVAVLTERQLELDILQIVVPNCSKIVGLLADRFYQHPTGKLQLIGITGTNGKTTTTYLVEKIVKDFGKKTGVIGTIEMRIGEQVYPVENTTPEPILLQQAFKQMVDQQVEVAVIEVSSHALELARVAGCDFRIAAFTNLTQDHLDFHQNMEVYKQAKAKLFSRLGNTYANQNRLQYAVINIDDPIGAYFSEATVAQVLTYGIDQDADVRAYDVQIKAEGVSFRIVSSFGETEVSLHLTGKFSVYNALAATSICLLQGIPLEHIKNSLEQVQGVPGRFEKVVADTDFTIIVDYAHTADSLENVLRTIKEIATNRIITVFGCGGDRDRKKRPLMGSVARQYSDISIVTSDNPRTEDPVRIIDDVMEAFTDAPQASYERIDDRTKAIEYAVQIAEPGDVILIAGKGHETYQIIGTKKYDFDDRLIASDAVKKIKGI